MSKENLQKITDSGLYTIILSLCNVRKTTFLCFQMDAHLNVLESHRAILYLRTRDQTSVGFYSIVSHTHTYLEIVSTQDD